MALTGSRWLWLALAGAVVVAAVLLRQPREWRSSVQDTRDRLRIRAEVASSRSARVAERLHLTRVRDSVRRAVPGEAAGVHVGAGFDAGHQQAVQRVAASLAPLTAGAIAMKVFIVQDTGQSVRGVPRRRFRGNVSVDHFMPAASSEGCVVVVRVNTRSSADHARFAAVGELSSQMTLRRILGPCSFFRSFGIPGSQMQQWIAQRGWQIAELGGWEFGRLTWVAPRWYSPETEFFYYDLMGQHGTACLAGDRGGCEQAFVAGPRASQTFNDLRLFAGGNYNAYQDFDNAWWSGSLAFGTLERTLLSDMVRDLGEERFRAFWTANAGPVEAFRTATGTSLDEWTYEWATSGYYKRHRGPAMASMAPAYSLLLVILAAALAIGAARRRQVR